MNTIKLSAALTAAVLAGALSTAAYAADAERPASRITVSGGSIILKKAINLDKAPGAGGIKGTITFNVAAGQDGDLPQAHTADEMLGTADQLASTTATAEFTADAQGKSNTESNVTVDFNMDKFTKPGIYYYRLTEQAHGISGLSTAPIYLLKVSVANESEAEPDGQHFKLEYAILAEKETGTKAELVTNEYTTHSLTVTKRLAGDFASYGDSFDFTLHITDPDTENHMASVTLRTGPADDELSGPGTVYTLENGEKEIKVPLKGNEQLEVTGLPEGATYTIDESGTDAAKYTSTTWVFPGGTGTGTSLGQQTIGTADAAITVTNTRDAVTPTGLLLDAAPYGAMLALAVGSGAVVFRKRRCD